MSIWIVIKDILQFSRDKKSFISLLLMPLILIAILGVAFGNIFGDDENVKIQRFTVGIVDKDKSDYSRILKEEVFEKSLVDMVELKPIDEEALIQEINDKTLKLGIIIPEDFSASLQLGEQTQIGLISGDDASIQTTVIESVIDQFAHIVKGNIVIGELLGEIRADIEQQGSANPNAESPNTEFDATEIENPMTEQSISSDQEPISSFQYYAAGMGVMFLLMTVVITVGLMIEEKEDEVYNRLLITRLKHRQYLLGKFIGLILICLVQFTIIILGTRLLFQVDWGNSISAIILTVLSFTISASGIGVFIGSFIKSEKTFNNIGIICTQVLAAIGGSMVPLYLFPEWLIYISKIIPNALALQMFLDVMSGAGISDIALEATVSILIGIVLSLIAWVRLSWKRGVKYA
ncbi:ABC transporter permease [Jeotgalibacillus marinus]|uniref:ABC transporter permease n=1 Tax=Jeotgalibacillus marinus TaxID=86667 RepID=A0ABV3Q795_9BACL